MITVETEVDIDVLDVIDQLSTDDLVEALEYRMTRGPKTVPVVSVSLAIASLRAAGVPESLLAPLDEYRDTRTITVHDLARWSQWVKDTAGASDE